MEGSEEAETIVAQVKRGVGTGVQGAVHSGSYLKVI